MKSLLKNIIIIGGLIGIIALGYYLLVSEKDAIVSSNSISVNKADIDTQAFLRKLQLIESLQISTDVFNNPAFTSLTNFTTPIRAVPAGRDNPFRG